MKKKILTQAIVLVLLSITVGLQAQVTIGSNQPPVGGALLDLKNQEPTSPGGITATKGLALPRVKLTDLNDITKDITDVTAADTDEHIGLTVYSVGKCDGIDEGLYVWNGNSWEALYSKVGSAIK